MIDALVQSHGARISRVIAPASRSPLACGFRDSADVIPRKPTSWRTRATGSERGIA
jgi:hypothetical protein